MGHVFGVGRAAPGFSLVSSDGSTVALKSFRGDWLPIVVFLAADSPDAAARLTALSAAADRFWGLRGQVLVLCDAGVVRLRKLAEEIPTLAFPLLADEQSSTAKAYGAFDVSRGVVSPVTYVVDRSGKIVWIAERDQAYDPGKLLEALLTAVR